MKLKDIREQYYGQTAKASDVARQLAFAGVAAIWVFKTEGAKGQPVVPIFLLPAAITFGVALFADLLQYATAARLWMQLNFDAEGGSARQNAPSAEGSQRGPGRYVEPINSEDDFPVPAAIHRLPTRYFKAKLTAVGLAYALLVAGLAWQLLTGVDAARSPTFVQPDSARIERASHYGLR